MNNQANEVPLFTRRDKKIFAVLLFLIYIPQITALSLMRFFPMQPVNYFYTELSVYAATVALSAILPIFGSFRSIQAIIDLSTTSLQAYQQVVRQNNVTNIFLYALLIILGAIPQTAAGYSIYAHLSAPVSRLALPLFIGALLPGLGMTLVSFYGLIKKEPKVPSYDVAPQPPPPIGSEDRLFSSRDRKIFAVLCLFIYIPQLAALSLLRYFPRQQPKYFFATFSVYAVTVFLASILPIFGSYSSLEAIAALSSNSMNAYHAVLRQHNLKNNFIYVFMLLFGAIPQTMAGYSLIAYLPKSDLKISLPLFILGASPAVAMTFVAFYGLLFRSQSDKALCAEVREQREPAIDPNNEPAAMNNNPVRDTTLSARDKKMFMILCFLIYLPQIVTLSLLRFYPRQQPKYYFSALGVYAATVLASAVLPVFGGYNSLQAITQLSSHSMPDYHATVRQLNIRNAFIYGIMLFLGSIPQTMTGYSMTPYVSRATKISLPLFIIGVVPGVGMVFLSLFGLFYKGGSKPESREPIASIEASSRSVSVPHPPEPAQIAYTTVFRFFSQPNRRESPSQETAPTLTIQI